MSFTIPAFIRADYTRPLSTENPLKKLVVEYSITIAIQIFPRCQPPRAMLGCFSYCVPSKKSWHRSRDHEFYLLIKKGSLSPVLRLVLTTCPRPKDPYHTDEGLGIKFDQNVVDELTRQPPIATMMRLRIVSEILRHDAPYLPQFKNNQKMPLMPSEKHISLTDVNKKEDKTLTGKPTSEQSRLARRWSISHFETTSSRGTLTIKLKRSLNTGIASAIIQAMTHSTNVMATHVPIESRLRLCIRSVPRNRRT